ncbi:DUF397 domain-containing protein [Streptomyces sp. NPDC057910]|uniref:DUF397 domain-containing protein n=1 Tax=Streptomyces sp. NPDC057910 TaxID=3346278 RepID=UPI0036E2B509
MTFIRSTEVASESAWFKSSHSSDQGGSCVEIAKLTGQVGIRDSKDKSGPALVVPTTAWSSFVSFANAGGNEAS